MRRPRLLLVLLLLVVSACGDDDGLSAEKLTPDADRSFVTPMRSTLIGIHGPGWALRVRLGYGDFPYYDAEMPLERRVWAEEAMLIRGPRLETYVRPPSGTPTMPLPTDGPYALHIVEDLWVRIVATRRLREPDAYVDVVLEPFHADGVRYAIPGSLRLLLKGPYP